METRRLILAITTLAAGPFLVSANATATTGLALMPTTVLLAGMVIPGACGVSIEPGFGPSSISSSTTAIAAVSKSQAILGGQASRLEAIAHEQRSSGNAGLAAEMGLPGSTPFSGVSASGCQRLVLPSASTFAINPGIQQKPLAAGDFLASKRLPVAHTAFDAQWERVSSYGVSHRLASAVAQKGSLGASKANLAAVNSWTNQHVRFVEDRVQYGQSDYWASAQMTLRRRAGDCEDIAIAKMQLLAALGVPKSSMYLTIARDLVRNADHALLIVKSDTGTWLLDNATNEVLDASTSHDFRPILSYSSGGKWLHGY
jgi:predicted transglutaminase-like cysteine proteinase